MFASLFACPIECRSLLRARVAGIAVAFVCVVAAGLSAAPAGSSAPPRSDETPQAEEKSATLVPGPLKLGKPKGYTDDFEWAGPEVDYKIDPVQCNGVDIGRLDFKFRPFFDAKGGIDGGGACLEGGFTANGSTPCPFLGQKPNTEYYWIQTIVTNVPKPGRGPGEYTDSNDPVKDPAYPNQSGDTNPAGNPFTGRSFYDGPYRHSMAGAVNWIAENMLCCRSGHKIHVIGSFLWGFNLDPDADNTDGAAGVHGHPRSNWGPATSSAIEAVAKEAKGTKTEQGWTIREGCCCANPFVPLICFSDPTGLCQLPIDASAGSGVLDRVLVFPRNRSVNFSFPTSPGWQLQPWPGGNIAPPMPYEDVGLTMWQQGALFLNLAPQPGPQTHQLQFRLSGHESFFDVFFHDAVTNQWINWVDRSQELLGDMNGDGSISTTDLAAWDLAFTNPAGYAAAFPGQNPVFRGDLSHNNVLDPIDRSLLNADIIHILETDAEERSPIGCIQDVDNNNAVDIDDLVEIITHWGQLTGSADINGNGVIDIDDLVELITHWGVCSE